MKCITYISQIKAKNKSATGGQYGLIEICKESRRMSTHYDVSGFLCYRNGLYIQALEGNHSEVDQLFKIIVSTQTHEDLVILFDQEIAQRSFRKWDVKLYPGITKQEEFREFIQAHNDTLSALPKRKIKLLGNFCDIEMPTHRFAHPYQGKDLALLSWPDLDASSGSPALIELCAALTVAKKPYTELVNKGEFGKQDEIDLALSTFARSGILKVTDSIYSGRNPDSAPLNSGFYKKMKTFLGLGKNKSQDGI